MNSKKPTTKKIDYVYRSTLKREYGLTDKLIKLLGKPDREVPNPHYLSGPPASLFARSRVNKFVKKHASEIACVAAKRPARIAVAKKIVQAKKAELIAESKAEPLVWKQLPARFCDILEIARSHAFDRYGYNASEPGLNGVVSTVRHKFTNYEQILAGFSGRVGTNEAYEIIRARLDEEIIERLAETYPDECSDKE